jgi:hypothetical protein
MDDKFKNIKLCNFKTKEIKSDIIKSDILKLLDQNIYLKKKKIILEEDIEILKGNHYPIMIELNSYRILILLTTYKFKKYCILIDQNIPNKIKMILVKIRFSEKLYNNTLLEGEIVLNRFNKWEILLYDIRLFKNEILNINFDEKMTIIENILKNDYVSDNFMQICPIKKKETYKFKDLINLINNKLFNYKYLVIGLSFITKDNYLLLNLHNKVYQNDAENNNENTILKNNKQFEIKKSNLPDIYELYNDETKIGIASIPTISISNMCNKVFSENKNRRIFFNCKYNSIFDKWEPLEFIKAI